MGLGMSKPAVVNMDLEKQRHWLLHGLGNYFTQKNNTEGLDQVKNGLDAVHEKMGPAELVNEAIEILARKSVKLAEVIRMKQIALISTREDLFALNQLLEMSATLQLHQVLMSSGYNVVLLRAPTRTAAPTLKATPTATATDNNEYAGVSNLFNENMRTSSSGMFSRSSLSSSGSSLGASSSSEYGSPVSDDSRYVTPSLSRASNSR